MLLAELEIKDNVRDKTYLVVFLSYWLCLSIFPHKGVYLPLGVFRIASLMADEHTFRLIVLVLVNIYHGLGLIIEASNLIGCIDFCFPMHYVQGWLTYYFNTDYHIPSDICSSKMANFFSKGSLIYFRGYEAQELIHHVKTS